MSQVCQFCRSNARSQKCLLPYCDRCLANKVPIFTEAKNKEEAQQWMRWMLDWRNGHEKSFHDYIFGSWDQFAAMCRKYAFWSLNKGGLDLIINERLTYYPQINK
jgi:hypothetical protein